MNERKKQSLTPNQALLKAANFCAYQERCQQEVREKLAEWGIWGNEAEQLLEQLIGQNYLNEERFAKAFAGGKFRTKHWGRVKIMIELKNRNISDYCIKKAMLEIDDDAYATTLKNEALKKYISIKDPNKLSKKNKTARYLATRGFEMDLIWDLLRDDKVFG